MKIIYVDVETTGLKRDKHSIWQLAGIITDGEGREETFNYKIAPYTDEPCSDVALEIGGVTEAEIRKFPSAEEVYHDFHALLLKYVNPYDKTDKLYFCGYNAEFDSDFLRGLFSYNGDRYFSSYFFHPVLDVMQLASWHFVGQRHLFKNFKLTTVYEHIFGKEMGGAHDAMVDIQATRDILNYIVKTSGLFKRN